MDPKITPSVNALVAGISEFLGAPNSRLEKMILWERGMVEVAVQCDTGPHVWLSTMWRPVGQPFRDIADRIETHPKGKPRHSGLKRTKWLSSEHPARCIKDIGDRVGVVVHCVRACAVDAGVVSAPEIVVAPVIHEALTNPSPS